MLLDDSAGGADARVQQALKPFVAVGGKVQSPIIGRDSERNTARKAGCPAISVRCRGSRRKMQDVTNSRQLCCPTHHQAVEVSAHLVLLIQFLAACRPPS